VDYWKMMTEDLLLSEDPTKIFEKGVINDKARKVLGNDSISKEKVMNRLGIEDEEIKQAELERIEWTEEQYARKRALEGLKNKRVVQKALGVLGLDPSAEKVMNTLGVDENELQEANKEIFERQEQQIIRSRKNYGSIDKKHGKKALDILGYDPSTVKIMSTLGMDEQDLIDHQQEQIAEYEQQLERKRCTISILNKKGSLKAQKVLGLDYSKHKLVDTLGIDDAEVEEAEQQYYERTEEMIKKKRMRDDRINKKHIQKALKVLGHDPSELKLEATLGVDKETIQKLSGKSSVTFSHQKSYFVYVPLVLAVSAVLMYFYTL